MPSLDALFELADLRLKSLMLLGESKLLRSVHHLELRKNRVVAISVQ